MLKGIRKDRTWIPATILAAGVILGMSMHWTGWLLALTMVGYIAVGTLLIYSPKLLLIMCCTGLVGGLAFEAIADHSWLGLVGCALLLLLVLGALKFALEATSSGWRVERTSQTRGTRSTST